MNDEQLARLMLESELLMWKRAVVDFARVVRTHPNGTPALGRWAAESQAGRPPDFPRAAPGDVGLWGSVAQDANDKVLKELQL
jgi:hypothetical protein